MERFAAAEDVLQRAGYTVLNPARISAELPKDETTWNEYMAVALALLATADAAYFLKGWQKSRGAVLECKVACGMDKKILWEDE